MSKRVEAVLELIRKHTPLTLKQEKFCNYACVQRFLKAKGDNVKRAAKQLRACLSWRESIGIEHLVADEFSAELADGLAYVAGHDHEFRPVMVHSFVGVHNGGGRFDHAKKRTTFCHAIRRKSASAFMNSLMVALKITGEFYPGRLHKAFIIDPPSLFPYLWKGVGAFVELSALTTVASSLDIEDDDDDDDDDEESAEWRGIRGKPGPCSSSRFAFTVSHHADSLKPWYLSLSDTSSPRLPPQRTPRPSFLQSPAGMLLFRRGERSRRRESLLPYWKLYRRPYDETVYRSKMRPPHPLIVKPRHLSLSQRF